MPLKPFKAFLADSGKTSTDPVIAESEVNPKADLYTRHIHVHIENPRSPNGYSKHLVKVHNSGDAAKARARAEEHMRAKGHKVVGSSIHKEVKNPARISSPEEKMRAREKHWHRTGVSSATTNWMRQQGML